MMDTDLSLWLCQELHDRGLSMRRFAQQIKFSHTVVTDVINGRARPSVRLCRAIAGFFDLPPEEVFRRAGLLPPDSEEETPSLREALHLFNQLSPDEREYILTTMRALTVRRKAEAM